jgi:hypothetical protein
MTGPRASLAARIGAFIDGLAGGGRDDAMRDALLLELLRYQVPQIAPWKRLVEARGVDVTQVQAVHDVPAVPTDVYRYVRLAVHDASEDVRVFRTSGTTREDRGSHALRDLGAYDRAARTAAEYTLFPEGSRMRLVVLAPTEHEAPGSSLAYMLARFDGWFGDGRSTYAWGDGGLDLRALEASLEAAVRDGTAVALLGTSFAFVHAEDALEAAGRRFALPPASRIMHTGGFKGRSREVSPDALRTALAARYGVPEDHVVVEYGMTELCSQMYEETLREAVHGRAAAPGRLWVPGWVRATPVHPDTLTPVTEGEVGILRVDDLANVDTPCAVQTADLARRVDGRIEVLGRAAGATARGCSLAVDEALGGRR